MLQAVKPAKAEQSSQLTGRILIADDDSQMRKLYQKIFADKFDITLVASGQEALDVFDKVDPDLVLLDIEMPSPNGYEVCRSLREFSNIPIIFVTAHQSLEQHLSAYDAGGNDIITKPIDIQIVLRKVNLALQHNIEQKKLNAEKASLQGFAVDFFSSVGESGILLNFMRASMGCRTYADLAEKLIVAARDFSVDCSVMIRSRQGNLVRSTHGEPTSLELSILENAPVVGNEFQFKNRLLIKQQRIAILVSNLANDDDNKAMQTRDRIVTLAETTEALIDNVEMRHESMARAEQMQLALGNACMAIEKLRGKSHQISTDSCMLLQDLIQNVEKTYSWLDTSKEQEVQISSTMQDSVQRILNVLAQHNETEQDFENVLKVLRGNNASDVDDILF